MTPSLVRLVAGTPSSVAIELQTLVRGQFVNSLLRMSYVAGCANTDLDSATLAPPPCWMLLFEQMKLVTKLNRKSLRAPEESGHHKVLQYPSMCHMSTGSQETRQDTAKVAKEFAECPSCCTRCRGYCASKTRNSTMKDKIRGGACAVEVA